LRELDAAGSPAVRVALRQPTLDDVFLALTGRSLRDGEQAIEEEIIDNEKVPA
jgi:ABC-2 type transport system ATP-binding protein